MQPSDLTIQQVIDLGDNSLQITGVDTNYTSYTTSMGRKSDLPDSQNFSDASNMTYFQTILANSIPPSPAVLYQAPDYTPPTNQP